MFAESQPSPMDWNFRLFGTPVRVTPWFWLVGLFLGFPRDGEPLWVTAVWIAAVFVSILLHEFGHVWMGACFGRTGWIELNGFGGLAFGASDLSARWKRILVSLAGPGIQLALFAVLFAPLAVRFAEVLGRLPVASWPWLPVFAMTEWSEPMRRFYADLLVINFYWALVNLLPVYPLDGGRVSREFFTKYSSDGVRISLAVSAATAAVIALNALSAANGKPIVPFLPTGGIWTVVLFGVLCWQSIQMYQAESAARAPWDDDRAPWER